MKKTVFWFLFLGLTILFPGIFCEETPFSWTREEPLSPSIEYHTLVIKKSGFNQKIHRVRVDLRSKTITAGILPSPDFSHKTQYPSDFINEASFQLVVPASLFKTGKHRRNVPVGNLEFSNGPFTIGNMLPEVQIFPLNHISMKLQGDNEEKKPFLKPETGELIQISGLNTIPKKPGLYLYTESFKPISSDEMREWNISRYYFLERVSGSSDSTLYWVRKVLKEPDSLNIPANNLFALISGKPAPDETPEFKYRQRVRVIIPNGKRGERILSQFCGGPYFLHQGKYNEEGVREFCLDPDTPSLSHYSKTKARMALTIEEEGRYLTLYAVDQKGFDRRGMNLEEFASLLIKNGVREALALPDGDTASLVSSKGLLNTNPSGSEARVISCLCISDKPPETGELINLLRHHPFVITGCGSSPKNGFSCLSDGSYFPTSFLDNYWEHITDDTFHKHGFLIDLLKSYEPQAIELFFAQEAGFSSHYNWRSFRISIHEKDKNSLKELMQVRNLQGFPSQYIKFPPGTRFRYIKIEIDKPTVFPNNRIARLAELALWAEAK